MADVSLNLYVLKYVRLKKFSVCVTHSENGMSKHFFSFIENMHDLKEFTPLFMDDVQTTRKNARTT